MKKIFLVTYRFNHHYAVSGYNRLAEFLPCTALRIPSPVQKLMQRFTTWDSRQQLIRETGLTGYFPECVWLEILASVVAKAPFGSIIHFIYPENSYYFTAQRRRSSSVKLVATYHQPVAESKMFILKTDAIRKLDAVILMSESQREFFEPLVGNDRIFVVPHGIDLEFFSPVAEKPRERSFVAVGSWLRDFTTLRAAVGRLQERAPDVRCDIVSSEEHRAQFAGLPNVRFHSGISDQELKLLYGRSHAAVLSLTGAGANNALLEALASGLPIVATDLPAVREYTPPVGCRYVPAGDGDCLASAVISLLDDAKGCAAMGRMNREHALRYDWKNVAEQTMNVYNTIANE